MKRSRTLVHGVLGGLLAGSLYAWGLFTVPDNLLHDLGSRLRPAEAADPRITVVAIDEASVRRIGRWPWPRERHLQMLERLSQAGAAVVAYNVFFLDPYKAPVDGAIGEAIQHHGRTLLPVYLDQEAGKAYPPITAVAHGAAALANPFLELGTDGVARQVRRQVVMEGQTYFPLGYEAYRLWTQTPDGAAAKPLPTQSDDLTIEFAAGYYDQPMLSFADVLASPPDLHGKIVLVGATAQGLGDTVSTPMAPKEATPSIQVQANLIGNLIKGRLVRSLPAWGVWLSLAAVMLGLSVLLQRLQRTWAQLAGVLALQGGIVAVSYLAFWLSAIKGSPMTLLTGTMAGFAICFLDTLAASNRALRREIGILTASYPGPRTKGLENSAEHGMETMRHLAQARYAAYRQRHGDRLVLHSVSQGCPRERLADAVTLDMLAFGGRCVRWEEMPTHLRPTFPEPHYVAVLPHLVNDRTIGVWEFYFTEAPSDLALAAPVWLMPFVSPPGPADEQPDVETADTGTLIRLLAQLGRQINEDRTFYEAVLLSPHAGLIVCDPWGMVLFHNPLVLQHLGLPAGTTLREANLITLINAAYPSVEAEWSEVWPEVVVEHQVGHLTLDGEAGTLSFSLTPIFNAQGDLVAVHGSLVPVKRPVHADV